MDSETIRKRFIAFFEEREHIHLPSSSLVPNDPTLLLTVAGMVQFKPFFLGEEMPPGARAVTDQKCFRTQDIDEVGRTARHLTFFEMLGNFSFGDYYKEKACPWAWELVTEGWGIDADRLWVSVYLTDDEAHEIWVDGVGVRPERVVRRGKADNFWSTGAAGPCGPCAEIYVDLGDEFGPASDEGPIGNEERYLEIWNLVFMQNDCNAQIEPIAELPKKNIDTGAGLERVALVLQNAASVFETDLLGALVDRAEELTGVAYGKDDRSDKALRVLADHGRGLSFLIADGVLPSNEKRGYILRRIMRRAIWHARLLGRNEPVLGGLIERSLELMGDAFPELRERKDLALEVAAREEERFDETLKQGTSLLETEVERQKSAGGTSISGEVAFKLHDTFGFPIDLTGEIADEAGLGLDRDRYNELMTEQRERARGARRAASASELPPKEALGGSVEPTEFVGHEHLHADGKIVAIAQGSEGVPVLHEGDEAFVVLDRTPLYAEGGGQVGDRGSLRSRTGEAQVLDTQKLVADVIGHRVRVTTGELAVGDDVEAMVDTSFRAATERAHTATHILHWTLRDRLGDHARQAGSLVEPGRLRFDFNHFEAVTPDQLADIAEELQTRVSVDDGVRAYETSYDFARSIGAMAIFGEKYGDFVRVVEVGDYSKELCGGTHVPHTSRIGVAVLTSEGSVGANLRRVEALVGEEGIAYLRDRAAKLQHAADLLKVSPDDVGDRIERVLTTQKEMERKLAEVQRSTAEADATALAGEAVDVDGTRLVVGRRDVGVDELRSLAQKLKSVLGSAVVVLGTAGEGRANLVAAVTKDVVARGISARDLLAPGATLLGGGAGGKPELAVSGGPQADRLEEAIQVIERAARDALTR